MGKERKVSTGINKIKLVARLIELGHQAEIIDGIPYILNMPYAKAGKVVNELGYKGSYGVKNRKE